MRKPRRDSCLRQSAAGHHARESARGLRRGFSRLLKSDGLPRRKTGSSAPAIRVLQQESVSRCERISCASRAVSKKIPAGYRFVVEIRNKNWLVPAFVDALRERHVGLALVDGHGCRDRSSCSSDSIRSRRILRTCAGSAIARASRKNENVEQNYRGPDGGTWGLGRSVEKVHERKFRFSRLRIIIMRGSGRVRLRSFEGCGGAPMGRCFE